MSQGCSVRRRSRGRTGHPFTAVRDCREGQVAQTAGRSQHETCPPWKRHGSLIEFTSKTGAITRTPARSVLPSQLLCGETGRRGLVEYAIQSDPSATRGRPSLALQRCLAESRWGATLDRRRRATPGQWVSARRRETATTSALRKRFFSREPIFFCGRCGQRGALAGSGTTHLPADLPPQRPRADPEAPGPLVSCIVQASCKALRPPVPMVTPGPRVVDSRGASDLSSPDH